MKLSAGASEGFLKSPDLSLIGALLYGPDAGMVALARRSLVAQIAEGDDLRVAQIDGATAAKDIAGLDGELRARGFFPGRRAVIVDGAKDGLAKDLGSVLDEITSEDAFLIVTASQLPARSALRKLFEGHRQLVSMALFPRALNMADVAHQMKEAGSEARFSDEAEGMLMETLAGMDPGGSNQLIDKVALSFLNRSDEIDMDELAAHLPRTIDAASDALVDAVVEGRPASIGPTLRRVTSGGVSAVQIMIHTTRRFRDLVTLSSSSDGIDAALGRLRPPVFGPRRQQLAAGTRRWGPKAEEALRLLFSTERQLRQSGSRPDLAIAERCLLRLAMMGAQANHR
ncbi:MAG: hypothetical protein AAGC81_05485 [Pseudomonadota bacterium]